jgi:hypothetical protein
MRATLVGKRQQALPLRSQNNSTQPGLLSHQPWAGNDAKMLMTNEQHPANKWPGKRILGTSAVLALLILGSEGMPLQEPWGWIALPMAAFAAWWIDATFFLPLVTRPIHYYHAVFLGTFVAAGPSSAAVRSSRLRWAVSFRYHLA